MLNKPYGKPTKITEKNDDETSKFRVFLMLTRALGDAFWEAKKFEDRPREMDPGPLSAVSLFRYFACAKKSYKKRYACLASAK